jgi:pyruvate/2-oxoglutarate dehydrogenase complex dihydrolipoamide dehydrogenase (E3) component
MRDYDIVIIGGSRAGLIAAIEAVKLPTRIALVLPSTYFATPPPASQILGRLGKIVNQSKDLGLLGLLPNINYENINSQNIQQYAELVTDQINSQYEPALLASMGIDVIFGDGEFRQSPDLCFFVNNRKLRSRRYLLAIEPVAYIPNIPGLIDVDFLMPHNCLEKLTSLPQNLVIIGADPYGIELAQGLARLGVQVTMIVKHSHILPQEDRQFTSLLQAILEAHGVNLLTNTTISQVKNIQGKKWLQADHQAIEMDQILLTAGYQYDWAMFHNLNLANVGVKFDQQGLKVNERSQTTNSRIYTCGNHRQSQVFASWAEYEGKTAVKNILYLPWHNLNYRAIPWSINLDPPLARVGLNLREAIALYEKNTSLKKDDQYENIIVSQQALNNIDQMIINDQTTGFAQLITHKSGQILGASMIGSQASELIHLIALAMQQNIKIGAISDLTYLHPSFATILGKLADANIQTRDAQNYWWQELLDNLFHWRRSFEK